MRLKRAVVNILFLFIVLISNQQAAGQSYGLGFAGNEAVYDKRTGLDLSPGKTFCFKGNFELNFDLTFFTSQENYFGYICRIIANDRDNIDLLFDSRLGNNHRHFRVVTGEQYSHISFFVDSTHLFGAWNKIRLRFDVNNQTLTLFMGDYSFREKIRLPENGCYKILFGANDYKDFKTTDVPPMKIRDVQLSEGKKTVYHWPLDESDGLTAAEIIQHRDAAIVNPIWMKKLHTDWQPLQTFSIGGPASIAFDPQTERLYVMGVDTMLTYSVALKKLSAGTYSTGPHSLLNGNQSLYDTLHHNILNTSVDDHTLAPLNLPAAAWDTSEIKTVPETNYLSFNKYYSPADTSVYLFGGYGHFQYKNSVQRYHIPAHTWEELPSGGTVFTPRYLSALGGTMNGAYIMGGYGSMSGQQLLNPRNFYDFIYFDAAKHTFKKLYELKVTDEDFVFANSLVINEATQTYYALIFPKHKYNSTLQLIKGSLKEPVFTRVGNEIPYLFQDIRSFADLYYCPASKRLLAVTLLYNGTRTDVNIYSLYTPPLAIEATSPVSSGTGRRALIAGIITALLLTGGLIWRKTGKRIKRQEKDKNIPAERVKSPAIAPAEQPLPVILPEEITGEPVTVATHKNTVLLFGDLQIYDEEGQDITKSFTPLLKELFLILLLYTLRWERGISPEKLNELLWFGKSSESARNNRAVNIAKLKAILEKVQGCTVTKETGYWKLNTDKTLVHIDYQDYLDIVERKKEREKDKDQIMRLAAIIRRGSFLSNVEYEWLDKFKSEISNGIIDACLDYAASVDVSTEAEFLVQLTDYVFYFDPVNEEAMTIKCRAFAHLGKHSLARNTYDSFCREYNTLYGEAFAKEFNSILS